MAINKKSNFNVNSDESYREKQSSVRVAGAAVFSRDAWTGSAEGMKFERRPECRQDTVM